VRQVGGDNRSHTGNPELLAEREQDGPVSQGVRLSVAGLALALVVFVLGTVVIPTRVSFGAGSMRCGTVLHPMAIRGAVPKVCGRAGANQLRATSALSGVMAVFSAIPWVLDRLFRRPRAAWTTWALLYTAFAAAGLLFLWLLKYSSPSITIRG
jgi:hypothetical protein